MLQLCPMLKSLELSGDIKPEGLLNRGAPICNIYLPTLRNLSVKSSHSTFPCLIRRIVALNLEKLDLRLQMMQADDVQFHSWVSLNPTLKRILSQDNNESGPRPLSLRNKFDSFTWMITYTIEDWRNRFTLQVESADVDWGINLVRTLDDIGPEFTVVASLEFAMELVPYSFNVISLTIDRRGDPRAFLRLLADPIEGVFPYPVLRELCLTPWFFWSDDTMEPQSIRGEVDLLLQTLWRRRGPPANPPIARELFDLVGKSLCQNS